MHDITTSTKRDTATARTPQRCARCGFHPASSRIGGYCSWDCYDADDEEADDEGADDEGADDEGEQAA